MWYNQPYQIIQRKIITMLYFQVIPPTPISFVEERHLIAQRQRGLINLLPAGIV